MFILNFEGPRIPKRKLNRLMCRMFGHRYTLAQRLTFWSRRVHCTCCHRSFAMNDNTKSLVDWDRDLENLYKDRGVKIKYLPTEQWFIKKTPM